MKKLLLAASFIGLTLACPAFYILHFTGEDMGDDRYADGSPLLEGECYAIIWQRSSLAFAGLNADGTPVDSNPENCEVIEILSGEYGAVVSEYDGELYAGCAEYNKHMSNWDKKDGGSYYLYALDTRIWQDGQLVVGGVGADGKLIALNAYEQVYLPDDGVIELSASTDPDFCPPAQEYYVSTSVENLSQLPADIPVPQFSWISVTNGIAMVSVTNTATYFGYGLSMTNDLALVSSTTNFVTDKSGMPLFKQGVGEGPLTWEIDVSAYQQGFFKLLRKSVLDE